MQDWCFHSRSRSSHHWSQSHSWGTHSGRHISPSPSPPHTHPAGEWISHSLSDLNLYPQWQSRSRTCKTHTAIHPCSLLRLVVRCPPLGPAQKQVQFNLTDDLGEAPSLLMGLANFLEEDIADEHIDAPCPLAPTATDLPQPPSDTSDQPHPTYLEGARP